jgi:hypothetical protein
MRRRRNRDTDTLLLARLVRGTACGIVAGVARGLVAGRIVAGFARGIVARSVLT